MAHFSIFARTRCQFTPLKFAPFVEVPSAILPATVARIAKKAGFALPAACLPVVAHGQSYTYADAAQSHALSGYSDPSGRLQIRAEHPNRRRCRRI